MAKKLNKLNYVENAEKVIKNLEKNRRGSFMLTTNKIRDILTLINDLYISVKNTQSPVLSEDIQSRIAYTKMKLAYEAGRDENKIAVKDFIKKSEIFDYLDGIGDNKEDLLLVCHYVEALVAYHKFYS